MNVHADSTFWNHASLSIQDIRLLRLRERNSRLDYRFPSSCFLYVIKGHALVSVDEERWQMNGDRLLHGGKGATLRLETTEAFECILLFYKACLPVTSGEPANTPDLEKPSPTQSVYQFASHYPGELRDTLQRMFQAWNGTTQTEKLQAKSLFYHFIYHLQWQLERNRVHVNRPGLLDQAIRYMNDHFAEPIGIHSVAEALNCSTRYLNKLFSDQLAESPNRVLTRIRMEHAARLLAESDISLEKIADRLSYSDVRVLSRVFKKQFQMTPSQYRKKGNVQQSVPKWSLTRAERVIGGPVITRYNDNGYQYHYSHRRKGEFEMTSRTYPSIALIMFVCFAVLLGGCATSGNNSNQSSDSATSSPSSSVSETPATAEPTVKSYTDSFGTRDIPVNPQRIYSIGATSALLALGIQPVGAPNYEVAPDYYLSSYPTPVNIVGDYPPSYEAIIELEPDLIVASGYIDEEVYGQLSKIAPTATFKWMDNTIYNQLEEVAEIVGKQEEAAAWIKAHEVKVQGAKERVSAIVKPDETVSILWINKDSFTLVGNRNVGHVIYNLLGMKPSAPIQKIIDENKGSLVYTDPQSLETLPDFDADRIIVMISDVEAGAEEYFRTLQKSAIWTNLEAVKNNQVYEVPYDKWWSYTIFSADGLLEDAVNLFK
ncbi:ABC transporter substrate-binding protein [Paenibacillus sp. strain BS8-2]